MSPAAAVKGRCRAFLRPKTKEDDFLTKTQQIRCHLAIHATSLTAAGVGAGLAQLPCADSVALVPLEVALVMALGAVFGIRMNQSSAEATLAGTTATLCGRGLSRVLSGRIPCLEKACDAVTAALAVQLVGWAVAADFDSRTKGKGKCKEDEKSVGHKKS
jgi:Uncharacterized protein/domain associated with GTPases